MTQGLKGKIFEKIAGRPYQTGALLNLADLHVEIWDPGKGASSFTNTRRALMSNPNHLDVLMEQPQLKESLSILNGYLIENPEQMLLSMLATKMSPAQVLKLLKMIHSSYKQGSYPIFHAILPAFDAKLTPEQTLEIFSKIIELVKRGLFYTLGLKALPDAFRKASRTMTSTQIFDLFSKLVPLRWSGFAIMVLPSALDAGMTGRQIIDLFTKISQKSKNGGDDAYYGLWDILQRAKGKLGLDQMTELVSELIDRFGSESGYSFYSVSDALEAQLTPKEIVDLFSDIIRITGNNLAMNAFRILSLTFKANLNTEQILELFTVTMKRFRDENDDNLFYDLESALKARPPFKELPSFLLKIQLTHLIPTHQSDKPN